jgi:N-methylhydantoinase A
MANAIRLLTIERGIDPRDYALVAFGGAGPLHACGVADATGIRRIIVPPHPGLCSAFGAAIAQLRVDRVWTLGTRAEATSEEALRRQFEQMEADASAELDRDGLQGKPIIRRSIECRYYLQNYEQEVSVADLEPGFLAQVCDGFHDVHRAFYGYAFETDPVELVYCRVTLSEQEGPTGGEVGIAAYGRSTPLGERMVVSREAHEVSVPILRRGRLARRLRGPLVIEELDSTLFVGEGWTVANGKAGTLVLTSSGSRSS